MLSSVSIRFRMIGMLVDHSLSESDAMEVMARVIAAADQDIMVGRWGDQTSDYSLRVLARLWVRVKEEAVAWIDENNPLHLARGRLIDKA